MELKCQISYLLLLPVGMKFVFCIYIAIHSPLLCVRHWFYKLVCIYVIHHGYEPSLEKRKPLKSAWNMLPFTFDKDTWTLFLMVSHLHHNFTLFYDSVTARFGVMWLTNTTQWQKKTESGFTDLRTTSHPPSVSCVSSRLCIFSLLTSSLASCSLIAQTTL